MNPKCNLSPEEREEAFSLFTGHLSYEQEREIMDLFPQYLFFRSVYEDDGWEASGSSFRLCTCSACGYEFEGVRINGARGRVHNESVTCPNCGRTLTGKAVYKFKYDMPGLQSWIKTAVAWTDESGALFIEAADARRRFTHDELTGSIDWYPKARYYIAPGRIQMWKEIIQDWSCTGHGRVNWQPAKTVGDPFQASMMGNCCYDGSYTVIGLYPAIARSGLKYCRFEDFFEQAMHATEGSAEKYQIKYLAWAALYPQIEMAVRWDFLQAVYELITDGKKNAKVLNWSGRSPAEFLRMDKQSAKLFLRSGMDFDYLKLWKENALGLSLKRFTELSGQFTADELRNVKLCADRSGESFVSCARYIQSLKAPCAAYALPASTIIQTWLDYLRMSKELGYDLSEKTVRMPKDLRQRHDAAAELIRVRKDEDEKKKYRKRLQLLRTKYEFSLGGLSIVVPECSEDIVSEGKILHHCVGGYAPRHIQGKTTILFLRHKRRPERSFLTIELDDVNERNVKIRQIHGYMNERYRPSASQKDKYAWFLNPWLEWVNSGSRRDGSGVPIIKEEVKTA